MNQAKDLTIKVKTSSRLMLLGLSIVLAGIGLITSEFISAEGGWATLILFCIVTSMFLMIVWINSSFERLIIGEKEISYRYFLFVSRKAPAKDLDHVTIGDRSGVVRFYVNDRKFANLNSSIIDVERDELIRFLESRSIEVEIIPNG